jgi:hypothetical protein
VNVEDLLAKVADNLSVRRAFGTAYEKEGMLIIPVAIVAGGGGGGTGRNRPGNPAAGPGSPPEEAAPAPDSTPRHSGRTEEGGGFGGLVLPSGAYVVKGDQVRWVPAVDVTIAVLASLSLVRMLARTWTRRRRHLPGRRHSRPGTSGGGRMGFAAGSQPIPFWIRKRGAVRRGGLADGLSRGRRSPSRAGPRGRCHGPVTPG